MSTNAMSSPEGRFEKKIDRSPHPKGCWLWTAFRDKDGYGYFWLDKRMQPAHRVAFLFANGVFQSSLEVLHACDNPGCVNPEHLFLGTHTDNMQDMIAKGRRVFSPNRGEEHGLSRITNEQAREILVRIGKGESASKMAREFSMSSTCVADMAHRRTWKHVVLSQSEEDALAQWRGKK